MLKNILKKKCWLLSLIFSPVWVMAQQVDGISKSIHADDPYSYQGAQLLNKTDNGYRGIWYFIGHLPDNSYVYKYAGGLGTYPSNIYPFSVYVSKVDKTFFCYGGTDDSGKTLYHEVAYYNHKTGKVSRPVIVLDKKTGDAHDNPAIQADKKGYIWLFSNAHGTGRPAFIHRSVKPYDISEFKNVHPVKMQDGKEVPMTNFSYLQIYYDNDRGFFGLFTHYSLQQLKSGRKSCRVAAYMTSPDGIHWSEWKDLANIEQGHYQTSGKKGKRIGSSFNYHPDVEKGAGLDYRTNLYYLFTDDYGKSWRTADGKVAKLPLTTITNDALVHDYASEGLKVYINDVNFDKNGNPVILYETTRGWEPGFENGPQQWYTAHWVGTKWEISPFTTSDNNYDMGSLYIEADGTWRVIAPTDNGPQEYNTGGSLVMWLSNDEGKSWLKVREMTPDYENNQSYPRRPVNAHPDFYAFWADGNGRKPSKSHLYFSDKKGNVFMLPEKMERPEVRPTKVFSSSFKKEITNTLRNDILKEAAWALHQKPVSVTAASSPRSAGGKHDFFSEGDYWWPDPRSIDSPYIRKDGMTNPDNFVAHRHAMIRFSRIVGALASAYRLTGKDQYVRAALSHCKAWFVDTSTLMNPSLLYSQAIKGLFTGRGIGIIDAIQLMEVAQGLAVMEDAKSMDKNILDGSKKWFSQFLQWLTTYKYGIDEMNAVNNHGTCWVMQVACFAKFTGNEKLMDLCRERYKKILLPGQMASDGSFPKEITRTKPYGYSIFNLDAMATICQILSTKEDNLWDYQTVDGRSIKKGIEFLYPFIKDKKKWPYKEDIMYWEFWPVAQPFLVFGAEAYHQRQWLDTWKALDHAPEEPEVIRNLPVRHPLIWIN